MSKQFHLAQINIAQGKALLDDPIMQGFSEQIDHINALAESSPGFVWRLQTEEGDATALKVFEDEKIIVNLSVWESIESLKDYVYTGDHLKALQDKKLWFDKLGKPAVALWWIPAGTLPTVEDAKAALKCLEENGPSPEAFTFSRPHPHPKSETEQTLLTD